MASTSTVDGLAFASKGGSTKNIPKPPLHGSKNTAAFLRRKSGVKTGTRKRTPRWEKEGDGLYQEIAAETREKPIKFQEAREILSKLTTPKVQKKKHHHQQAKSSIRKDDETPKKTAPPHMVWGPLPVGPILSSRLNSCLDEPTPVQIASFPVILKGQNTVIASPTGTGKTLAYLVPLLATKLSRQVPCGMIVVTPTVELAAQIGREVDKLWPNGACHVVGEHRRQSRFENNDDDAEQESLLCESIETAPILAGTPRMLRELLREVQVCIGNPVAETLANSLRSNLKTIVLDEADRLLRTEGVARDAATPDRGRNSRKRRPKKSETQTETLLLKTLPCALEKLQIICASATVGRTLRRQLMNMLDAPSIDKAAALVTADERATGKDVAKRTASLVPDTLTHAFRLIDASTAEKSKDKNRQQTVDALWDTLNSLKPAPTLIFPNRLGVETVQLSLRETHGLKNVLSLNDVKSVDQQQHGKVFDDWQDVPIYVVADKFARGLDLPDIDNVILLAPPSSAAGYTHLAGRTGRNGRPGTTTTLVRPRESPKLVAIAEQLGLCFADKTETLAEVEQTIVGTECKDVETGKVAEITYEWENLSESALKRKTVAELTEYLETHVSFCLAPFVARLQVYGLNSLLNKEFQIRW